MDIPTYPTGPSDYRSGVCDSGANRTGNRTTYATARAAAYRVQDRLLQYHLRDLSQEVCGEVAEYVACILKGIGQTACPVKDFTDSFTKGTDSPCAAFSNVLVEAGPKFVDATFQPVDSGVELCNFRGVAQCFGQATGRLCRSDQLVPVLAGDFVQLDRGFEFVKPSVQQPGIRSVDLRVPLCQKVVQLFLCFDKLFVGERLPFFLLPNDGELTDQEVCFLRNRRVDDAFGQRLADGLEYFRVVIGN